MPRPGRRLLFTLPRIVVDAERLGSPFSDMLGVLISVTPEYEKRDLRRDYESAVAGRHVLVDHGAFGDPGVTPEKAVERLERGSRSLGGAGRAASWL